MLYRQTALLYSDWLYFLWHGVEDRRKVAGIQAFFFRLQFHNCFSCVYYYRNYRTEKITSLWLAEHRPGQFIFNFYYYTVVPINPRAFVIFPVVEWMSNHMKSPAIKDLHFSWYLKILSNYTRLKARANVSHSVYQFLKIDYITRDPHITQSRMTVL